MITSHQLHFQPSVDWKLDTCHINNKNKGLGINLYVFLYVKQMAAYYTNIEAESAGDRDHF